MYATSYCRLARYGQTLRLQATERRALHVHGTSTVRGTRSVRVCGAWCRGRRACVVVAPRARARARDSRAPDGLLRATASGAITGAGVREPVGRWYRVLGCEYVRFHCTTRTSRSTTTDATSVFYIRTDWERLER